MLPERWMTQTPDRIIYLMDGPQDITFTKTLADSAVATVKAKLPKITGNLSRSVLPVFGPTFWGIYFPDKRAWYLERGTGPRTMRNLVGKTIPMWVDDPDGSVAKKEGKKAKTRLTQDGRAQVLIFRKVSEKGARKMIVRQGKRISVPASYPGAPGRIGNPRGGAGRIAMGNSGVRWRHPGIEPRNYMNEAIETTLTNYGLEPTQLLLIDASTYPTATKS